MKTCWLLIMVIGLCSSITSFGQIFNTNYGDWSVSGNWTPSGVPTGQTTAVTISQNVIVSTDLRTAAGTQGIGNVTVANKTNNIYGNVRIIHNGDSSYTLSTICCH